MPGSIFILREDGTLIEMQETPYDSEALLQSLLAEYSNLLAGDQINPGKPRRCLLVSREMRVSGDDGADHGYFDHLISAPCRMNRPFTKSSSTIAAAFDSIAWVVSMVAMPIERYYAQGTKSSCAEKRESRQTVREARVSQIGEAPDRVHESSGPRDDRSGILFR
jgi:hypothetical protein